MKNQEADIQFLDFKVLESHIVFREKGDYKINVGFKSGGIVKKESHQFILKVGIRVNDEKERFFTEVQTESLFRFNNKIPLEDLMEGMFILNAPAIIFPYIRAYITNLTAQSGMPPLVLPTLNLSGIGKELKENIVIEE